MFITSRRAVSNTQEQAIVLELTFDVRYIATPVFSTTILNTSNDFVGN